MLSTWLLVAIIIIAVITMAVGIGWIIRNNNEKSRPPISQGFSHPLVWGPSVPGKNVNKNTCQIYQFPTTLGQSGIAYVGAPTFNANSLDQMTGVTFGSESICVDVDEIIAQQVQHSCTGPLGVLDNSLVKCNTLNGKTLTAGGIETYYSDILCPNIQQCPGELSLVSLNYHGLSTDIYCITKNSDDPFQAATMTLCDPSNQDQLFRVTRTNPGQDPSTLQPGSQSGMLTQIYDRNSGLCLIPGTTTYPNRTDATNLFYFPTFVEDLSPSCTGMPPKSFSGLDVTMGECTGGPYPGYVWALFPSISYCGNEDGCSGCATGYTRAMDSNECCPDLFFETSTCGGTGGYESYSTPQQIFYIGDDYNDIPIASSANDIFTWILSNNTPRLFFGGSVEYNDIPVTWTLFPILLPIIWQSNDPLYPEVIITGNDSSTCSGLSSTAQYINLQLYNTLTQEAPCVAQDISEVYCNF